MKLYSVVLAVGALSFASCNSEKSETTGPIPENRNAQQAPITPQFNQNDTQVTIGATPVPVTNTSTASNLNPPHGQPGHRCDIEVGKPLDSKPIQATIPANQTITTLPQQANPAPGANANPPHGQPGHRCDIAVGAPLK